MGKVIIINIVVLLACLILACRAHVLASVNFSWCVARKDVSRESLEKYIDDYCKTRTCTWIKPGGLCYVSPTCCNRDSRVRKHASYILNRVYKGTTECSRALGRVIHDNPSYGRCRYP